MDFLIDTHTLIWFLENDTQLSDKARLLIEDTGNEISVSMASFWEITIKKSIGKLSLSRSIKEILDETDRLGIDILPISTAHLLYLESLVWHHRDPFDRLIAAQCLEENLTLISKDAVFDLYFQGTTAVRTWI